MRILLVILCLMIMIITSALGAVPAGYQIDQRSDETTGNHVGHGLWDNIAVFAPMGQTFVPTYSSLNGIEIYFRSYGSGYYYFRMQIRHNGPSGTVVGEQYFSIPANTDNWVFVPIQSSLDVRDYYAFLVWPQSNTINCGLMSDGWTTGKTYPKGRWILNGYELDAKDIGNDLAFRTYTYVPEAPSILTLSGGVLGLVTFNRLRKR